MRSALTSLFLVICVGSVAGAQLEAPAPKASDGTAKQGGLFSEADDADQPNDWTKTWGNYDPGKGFKIARTPYGSMNISGYMLLRYLNQLPAEQSFSDHNGVERKIDTRQDIQLHRFLLWLRGFIYDPKFTYVMTAWGLNSTNQTALIGALNYHFSKAITIGGGVEGLPGIRSLNGQHPYFLGTDRQLAEDFFRPGFNSGIWMRGEALPGLDYRLNLTNNLSQVGISAAQITRDLAYGASVWWMPTTHEFGPRGGYGDYEMHEKLATRFGFSTTYSREDHFADPGVAKAGNNQVRLSDSTNPFDTGSLAPGVTLRKADYHILSLDGAMKYQGLFFQTEYFLRWLSRFDADGPLQMSQIFDHGFATHIAYQLFPKKFEIYEAISYIFGDFNRSYEFATGGNYYPFNTRNVRVNGSIAYVEKSAANALFGYYVGGQTGVTVSLSTDLFF